MWEKIKQNNVLLRLIVALIILPIVSFAVYLGGDYFKLFMLLLVFQGAHEWINLTDKTLPSQLRIQFYGILFGSAIFMLTGFVFWGIVLFVALIALYALRVKFALRSHPYALSLGFIYLFIPLMTGLWLRLDTEQGLLHFCLLVAVMIATDTTAFFVGRTVQGPKLAPSISPKKTWSGSIGGVLGAILVCYLFEIYVPAYKMPLSFWIMGFFLSVIGQMGDLFESHMKRRFGVKDSGTILPGHGGILDRVDSYLFGIPIMALLVYLSF